MVVQHTRATVVVSHHPYEGDIQDGRAPPADHPLAVTFLDELAMTGLQQIELGQDTEQVPLGAGPDNRHGPYPVLGHAVGGRSQGLVGPGHDHIGAGDGGHSGLSRRTGVQQVGRDDYTGHGPVGVDYRVELLPASHRTRQVEST